MGITEVLKNHIFVDVQTFPLCHFLEAARSTTTQLQAADNLLVWRAGADDLRPEVDKDDDDLKLLIVDGSGLWWWWWQEVTVTGSLSSPS